MLVELRDGVVIAQQIALIPAHGADQRLRRGGEDDLDVGMAFWDHG